MLDQGENDVQESLVQEWNACAFAQDEDIFRSAHAQNGNLYSLSSLVSQHTDNSELRHA